MYLTTKPQKSVNLNASANCKHFLEIRAILLTTSTYTSMYIYTLIIPVHVIATIL